MGLLHLVFLAGLAAFAHGKYVPCPDATGTIVKVTVNNNDVSNQDAILKKGTNATLMIEFKPAISSKTSTSHCHGIISGVPVPFPVPSDGCLGMNPKCPITADKTYTFTTSIEVKTLYPSLSLAIKWQETGDSGKDLMCVVITARIEG